MMLITLIPIDLWIVFGVHAWLFILAIPYMGEFCRGIISKWGDLKQLEGKILANEQCV